MTRRPARAASKVRAATPPAKLRWVAAQYDVLRPEGQLAIDLCFKAFPRRPGSELAPSSDGPADRRQRRRM